MFRKKIVFFGTTAWDLTNRHLKYFIEAEANISGFVVDGRGSAVTTVRSSKDFDDITLVAKESGLPVIYCTDVNSSGYFADLKKINADIFIVCGYQFFLPEQVLKLPPLGVLNFHSSLLPRHAGRHPGFWTIWYGDSMSGMTVHHMDGGLDTGDIAYNSVVPVLKGDTVESLYGRIWDTSPQLIKQLLADAEKETIPANPQDYSHYFYNYEITDSDFEIDFRYPAGVLYNRVRMLPGKFYFKHRGDKIFIHDCLEVREFLRKRNFISGTPILIEDEVYFVIPRGLLKILDISKDNRRVSLLSLF